MVMNGTGYLPWCQERCNILLTPSWHSKNRVIVSSFSEPELLECCWYDTLFQPDFAINGIVRTAHLQEAGLLENHRIGLTLSFPPLSIFLLICPSLQYCPLLPSRHLKLSVLSARFMGNRAKVCKKVLFSLTRPQNTPCCLCFVLFPVNFSY